MATNSQIVTTIYGELAGGLAPPAADLATYTALLNSGTYTTAQVVTSIESEPFIQNVVNPIIREYQAAFGRVPDQAGLTYWINVAAPNGASGATNGAFLNTISTIFANSAEFQNRYGVSATTPVNASVVTSLYTNVLGRAPDQGGLTYWTNSGLSVAQLLTAFAQSAEFISDTAPAVTAFLTLETTGAEPTTGSLFQLLPGGQSATLTTGNDTVNGVTTVNADLTPYTYNGKGPTLNTGDVLNNITHLVITDQYGQGNDVIPSGAFLANVADINLTTQGVAGGGNSNTAALFDVSGVSGLQSVEVTSYGGGTDNVKASSTATIFVTQNNTGASGVHTQGGSSVTVIDSGAPLSSSQGGTVAQQNTQVLVGSTTQPGANPTGVVIVKEFGNNPIYVYGGSAAAGGTAVNVSTTGSGAITIGNNAIDTQVPPSNVTSGNIVVSDTDTVNTPAGTIGVYGGQVVQITSAPQLGGAITVGTLASAGGGTVESSNPATNQQFVASGNVTVSNEAAFADTKNYFSGQTQGFQGTTTVVGGANITVATDTGGVVVGAIGSTQANINTLFNGTTEVTAPGGGLLVSGAVNITDTSNVGGGVFVYGGVGNATTPAVTINTAGTAVTVGSVANVVNNITNVAAPIGAVLINDGTSSAAPNQAYDQIANSTASVVSVLGAGVTNVTVSTNAGSVLIGNNANTPVTDLVEPTGVISVTDSAGATNPNSSLIDGLSSPTNNGVQIFGGATVSVIDSGGTVQIGTNTGAANTDPTGAVSVQDNAIQSGSQQADAISVYGGNGITIATTGASSVTAGSIAAPVAGAVSITDSFNGSNLEDTNIDAVTVLGGAAVAIKETASTGAINVGFTAAQLNAAGLALLNANEFASGNVSIYDASGTGKSTIYGTGNVTVNTNGAQSVSIVGGGAVSVLDEQTTTATTGVGAGLPIGPTTLSTVILDGVTGGAKITTDAAALSLSVFDVAATNTYTVMEVGNHALNLTVGNEKSSFTVGDANATSVTVGDAATLTGGTAVQSSATAVVTVNVGNATTATFTNTGAHTFNLVNDPLLSTIVANNTGALTLQGVNNQANLVSITGGTSSSGAITAEIFPDETSFNGAGSSGLDTITLDENTSVNFITNKSDVIQGSSNALNVVVANYAAAASDAALSTEVSGFSILGLGANATSIAGPTAVYNAGGFSGVTLGIIAGPVIISNANAGAFLSVTKDTGAAATVTFLGANTTGISDALTVNLGSGTTNISAATGAIIAPGYEALTVNSVGGKGTNTATISDVTSTGQATLAVTGSSSLSLTDTTSFVTSVSDSGSTAATVTVVGVKGSNYGVTFTGTGSTSKLVAAGVSGGTEEVLISLTGTSAAGASITETINGVAHTYTNTSGVPISATAMAAGLAAAIGGNMAFASGGNIVLLEGVTPGMAAMSNLTTTTGGASTWTSGLLGAVEEEVTAISGTATVAAAAEFTLTAGAFTTAATDLGAAATGLTKLATDLNTLNSDLNSAVSAYNTAFGDFNTLASSDTQTAGYYTTASTDFTAVATDLTPAASAFSLANTAFSAEAGFANTAAGDFNTENTDSTTLAGDLGSASTALTTSKGSLTTLATDLGTQAVAFTTENTDSTTLATNLGTASTDFGAVKTAANTLGTNAGSASTAYTAINAPAGTLATNLGTASTAFTTLSTSDTTFKTDVSNKAATASTDAGTAATDQATAAAAAPAAGGFAQTLANTTTADAATAATASTTAQTAATALENALTAAVTTANTAAAAETTAQNDATALATASTAAATAETLVQTDAGLLATAANTAATDETGAHTDATSLAAAATTAAVAETTAQTDATALATAATAAALAETAAKTAATTAATAANTAALAETTAQTDAANAATAATAAATADAAANTAAAAAATAENVAKAAESTAQGLAATAATAATNAATAETTAQTLATAAATAATAAAAAPTAANVLAAQTAGVAAANAQTAAHTAEVTAQNAEAAALTAQGTAHTDAGLAATAATAAVNAQTTAHTADVAANNAAATLATAQATAHTDAGLAATAAANAASAQAAAHTAALTAATAATTLASDQATAHSDAVTAATAAATAFTDQGLANTAAGTVATDAATLATDQGLAHAAAGAVATAATNLANAVTAANAAAGAVATDAATLATDQGTAHTDAGLAATAQATVATDEAALVAADNQADLSYHTAATDAAAVVGYVASLGAPTAAQTTLSTDENAAYSAFTQVVTDYTALSTTAAADAGTVATNSTNATSADTTANTQAATVATDATAAATANTTSSTQAGTTNTAATTAGGADTTANTQAGVVAGDQTTAANANTASGVQATTANTNAGSATTSDTTANTQAGVVATDATLSSALDTTATGSAANAAAANTAGVSADTIANTAQGVAASAATTAAGADGSITNYTSTTASPAAISATSADTLATGQAVTVGSDAIAAATADATAATDSATAQADLAIAVSAGFTASVIIDGTLINYASTSAGQSAASIATGLAAAINAASLPGVGIATAVGNVVDIRGGQVGTGQYSLTETTVPQPSNGVTTTSGMTTINYATANDTFISGSAGGTYTIGLGGSWDSTIGGYSSGSETINLAASTAAVDTLKVLDGAVATANGNSNLGGVSSFTIGGAKADVVNYVNAGGANLTKKAIANVGHGQYASISVLNGATAIANLIDPSGNLATLFTQLTFVANNGVITFSAVGASNLSQFTAENFISAAEAIVNSSSTGGGANNQIAAFSTGGNTYVVAEDAANTLAGGVNDKDSVVELLGQSTVTGFASSTGIASGTVAGIGAATSIVANVQEVNASSTAAGPTFVSGTVGGSAITYNDTGFSLDQVNLGNTAAATGTTTFNNLAPASELIVNAGGNALSTIVVNQTGVGAGANSLVVDLQAADTLTGLTINNDWALSLLTDNGGTATIQTLLDNTGNLTTLSISGAGSLSIQALTATALTTVNAGGETGFLTLGQAATPLTESNLTITGALGGDNIFINGATNTVNIGTTTAAVTGVIDITATSSGNHITVVNQHFTGQSNFIAAGNGNVISVDTGLNYIAGGIQGTNLSNALGTGDTITLADGQAAIAATDKVWVGANSLVSLTGNAVTGAASTAFGVDGGGATATIFLTNDVTGVTSSGIGQGSATAAGTGLTTIAGAGAAGLAADGLGANGSLTLVFNNVNAGGAALNEYWAGNSVANAFVNVSSASSLTNALDIAAAQGVIVSAQHNNNGVSTVGGVAELNGSAGILDWFQYGGNTYVVEAINNSTTSGLGGAATHTALTATDSVVELVGLVNLNNTTHVHFTI